MRKYKKAKIVFEDKAIDKKRKPIYATRKLSIGLVSCMLGVMLFVPTSKADEENPLPASEQIEKNTQPEQTQDLKAGLEETTNNKTPENNQEELLTADEIQEIKTRANSLENSYFFNGNMVEELKAELRKAKADPSVNYEEAKASLINEAIIKNTPAQKAPGETREEKEIDPTLTKPIINNVAIGETTVTGNGLVKPNRRKKAEGPCKIHVTVTNNEGHKVETKTFTIEKDKKPKKGEPEWSVTLDNKVQKGYKIIAQQELNGKFSNPSDPYTVKELIAAQYDGKLTMPQLEVWSEDMFVPEADAIEDIKNAFKKQNNTLENVEDKNFEGNLYAPKPGEKKEPLSVDWGNKKINVTFSDNSTLTVDFTGKVDLKKIEEKSNPAVVENLTIVDGEIKGKISGNGPFTRARVTIVKFGNEDSKNAYCKDGKCTVDKDATELATILVDETTGEFIYKVKDNDLLKIGQNIGLTVKEYRKKVNCSVIQPQIKIPNVKVRDPKKLTKEEKEEIIEKIREANKVNGVSKLPDGTGDNTGIPAVIQIDDQGNVKIISGNDVKVKGWDSNYNAIPETNDDESPIFQEGKGSSVAETTTKDIVVNKAPDAPTISTDVD